MNPLKRFITASLLWSDCIAKLTPDSHTQYLWCWPSMRLSWFKIYDTMTNDLAILILEVYFKICLRFKRLSVTHFEFWIFICFHPLKPKVSYNYLNATLNLELMLLNIDSHQFQWSCRYLDYLMIPCMSNQNDVFWNCLKVETKDKDLNKMNFRTHL